MPRRNFSDGQELVFGDFNKISSAIEREFYDRAIHEIVQRTSDAFFGSSFQVSYLSPTSIQVSAGLGIQNDASAISPEPTKKPLYLPTAQNVNITAPSLSNDRIDIVCVRYAETNEVSESRKYKDATSGAISNQTLVVQRDKLAEILVVAGTPAPSPVAPATPAGYIKIATLAVTTVTGMSGPGAITDDRTLMPLGGSIALNTSTYQRLPAGVSTPISTLMSAIDGFIKNGFYEYFDIQEINSPTAEPANPASGRRRVYWRDGVLFARDSSGSVQPIGSGGGGGGGATWIEPEGMAFIKAQEFETEVYMVPQATSEEVILWIKVPSSYLPGRQIKMRGSMYSPSASNAFRVRTRTTLIRKNTDAVNSIANQHTSTNAALTNTVANRLREQEFDLTSSSGGVNSVAVQPGDLLKIEVIRPNDGTDTDTADVRFIPSAVEFIFQ